MKLKRVAAFVALMIPPLTFATGGEGNSPDFSLSGGDELIPLYEDTVLVFRQSGMLRVTGSGYVDILAVGGGGGGGSNGANYGGAGGGAGGVVHQTGQFVTSDDYPIVIGEGGEINRTGGTTTIAKLGIAAYGGGKGANGDSQNQGGDGASGGGAAIRSGGAAWDSGGAAIYASASNKGNPGGGASNPFGSGGGGGAGEGAVGETTGSSTPGRGGDGYCCDIVGTNVYYGGGGAGYRKNFDIVGGKGGGGSCVKDGNGSSTAEAGVDGLGGGGCGGARGGNGVVIVRYRKVSYKTAFIGATGGTRTRRQGHYIHTFMDAGIFTMPVDGLVEVLLVGGGGGGGENLVGQYSNYQGGGGGGAGGVIHLTNLVLRAGSHPIVIGKGGGVGTNGEDTVAFDRIAYGGGAGAKYDGRNDPYVSVEQIGNVGSSGASGGGSTHARKSDFVGEPVAGGAAIYIEKGNLGHDGGICTHQYGASGGGGAGGAGCATDGTNPGKGGIGYLCDISGTVMYYAGGGAGFRDKQQIDGGLGGGGACKQAADRNSSTPMAGEDGLGGGGCGGARGGSGVVIVRYKISPTFVVSFK